MSNTVLTKNTKTNNNKKSNTLLQTSDLKGLCEGSDMVQRQLTEFRVAVCFRVSELEAKIAQLRNNIYELNKEVITLQSLKKKEKVPITVDASLEGFAQYQSIEATHPLFKKALLSKNPMLAENPNNVLCFTPTTYNMFFGTPLLPPMFSIYPIKSHEDPIFVEVKGRVEQRYRVDIVIEFRSTEGEDLFQGVLKEGSSNPKHLEYHSFVSVINPDEFVDFLTQRYRETLDRWASF